MDQNKIMKQNYSAVFIHNDIEVNLSYKTAIKHINSIGGITEKMLQDCDFQINNVFNEISKQGYSDITVNKVISIDNSKNVYYGILIIYKKDNSKEYYKCVMHNNNNAYTIDLPNTGDVKFLISKIDYFKDNPEYKTQFVALLDFYDDITKKYNLGAHVDDRVSRLEVENEDLEKEVEELKTQVEHYKNIISVMKDRMESAIRILSIIK